MVDLTPLEQICDNLQRNEQYKLDVQRILKTYVQNREIPLDIRFPIWEKWVNKYHLGDDLPEDFNFPVIRKMIDEQWPPYSYDAPETITYRGYLHVVQTAFLNKDKNLAGWERDVTKFVPSVDAFKEALINCNFGSFYCEGRY